MNENPMEDVMDLMSRLGGGPTVDREDIEPVRWMHSGLTCHILSGGYGSLCGYVNIPEDNPAYDKGYDDEITYDLEVHGGVTYGDVSRLSGKGLILCIMAILQSVGL